MGEAEVAVVTTSKKVITYLTVIVFVAVSIAVITTVLVLPNPNQNNVKVEMRQTWRWECLNDTCQKFPMEEAVSSPMSLGVCKMFCNDYGGMWPRPNGIFKFEKKLTHINKNNINIKSEKSGPAAELMDAAFIRFQKLANNVGFDEDIVEGGTSMTVIVNINNMSIIDLDIETDEFYDLTISTLPNGQISGAINANTFFGARHGIESLVQFIIYDDINQKIMIPNNLTIIDKPAYPYRGISLDTSRNFYTIESLKRTLDGMAACKLNRFHWHITDSHSFSFYSKTYPELTRLGALSAKKVYLPDQITDLVKYAIERGVKIVPEFDAPAHVGEGWQNTNMTVCFKGEPWFDLCAEPPCGQFNPTIDGLYDMLEGIYTDLFDLFKPDIFHMGGDEVNFHCWNTSEEITTWMMEKGWGNDHEGFLELWNYFQSKAMERLKKVSKDKHVKAILWTSSLTELSHVEDYLDKDDYIIQIWTLEDDPIIKGVLEKDYQIIITNYDALYLDCGFGAWVGEGNNWCSPYAGWQKVYNNTLGKMTEGFRELVLGSEAALWSEQADSTNVDSRLWPRAGALAEVLWADPKTSWRDAEYRMLLFRNRLVSMGINADALEPEWCYQNEGYCYL